MKYLKANTGHYRNLRTSRGLKNKNATNIICCKCKQLIIGNAFFELNEKNKDGCVVRTYFCTNCYKPYKPERRII